MPPKLRVLQQRCKDAGLDPTGKYSELAQRLKDDRIRKKALPADQEDPTCDAILVTQSMTGSEDDMKRYAHDALTQTLQVEELEVQNVKGELYVGNPRGLGLAGLPQLVRLLDEENAASKAKIVLLTDYVSILRIAGPDYRRVRNRFLSVYKRDKMEEPLQAWDWNFIHEGNIVAHSGDATTDALLYEGVEGRHDDYVFEELYGLHPSAVQKITHKETVEMLNLHASVKANDNPRAVEFYRRFAVFVAAFRREVPGYNYLQQGPTNATCAAYWSLRQLQI